MGRIIFDLYSHDFKEFSGDDFGYTSIEDHEVLFTLTDRHKYLTHELVKTQTMIRLVRKYGVQFLQDVSRAAFPIRDLKRDIRLLDSYKDVKSNDPRKIGKVAAELRKTGRPALVKQLARARRKLTKEQREVYDALKKFG